MNKKNLMPQAAQPVNRTTVGQLPPELAELSEEALSQVGGDAYSSTSVLAGWHGRNDEEGYCLLGCSYDGDDAE